MIPVRQLPHYLPDARRECLAALANAKSAVASWNPRVQGLARIADMVTHPLVTRDVWTWDDVALSQQIVAYLTGIASGVAACHPEAARIMGLSAWSPEQAAAEAAQNALLPPTGDRH